MVKVIKPGRPLVVPTERATCWRCEAVLEYEARDLSPGPPEHALSPSPRWYVVCPQCDAKIVVNSELLPGHPHR